ncbi:MAG: SH3 domain-containing protein [Anaerolineales bacterium]
MTVKQYSQRDPQWSATLLGFDKVSTIGNSGALLASMSMCAAHYGAPDLTPAILNERMKAIKGFQAGTGLIYAGMIGQIVPGMTLDYRSCPGSPAPMAEIDSRLAMNQPVIIQMDSSLQPGLQTNYSVLYAKQGSDYLAYDPYSWPTSAGQIKLSQSAYAQIAGSTDPAKIITAVFFSNGNIGSFTPATPQVLDKGVRASFPVYAAADALALRSQAIIADFTLLNRYPLNTQFIVLESDAIALSKLGQYNQWLAVKAPDGLQGYMAAWLLSRAQTIMPIVDPVYAPTNAAVVQTNVDALRLRTRPGVTSDETTTVKFYPIGTGLRCLESDADVMHKVGVMDQWLKVSDICGDQGFVAAWYVSIVSIGAYGPQAVLGPRMTMSFSVDEVPPVIVRALEENLALRSAPLIATDTLIYRVTKGAELTAIEALDTAATKIGKLGEWMHVQDVNGNKGYVAAWLVKERPEDPAPQLSPEDC